MTISMVTQSQSLSDQETTTWEECGGLAQPRILRTVGGWRNRDPRVFMVRETEGAAPGDWVRFDAPGGSERMVPVPPGLPAGQYFEEPLDIASI
mmetsp:Transcript_72854/g.156032  ORF Transcript_72854/g.156032 Transcript_72854/m.156032 type:complete len:94 (+) Transcript_72854:1-282(+)